MKRRWMVCAAMGGALVCLSASMLMAKPGIVKTKDGRTFEGDVTEKADGVVVSVRGIPTNVNRDDIASVQYTGSIDQQYQEKVAALPKTPTAKDRLEIARWLFDAKAYELARKEVDEALKLDPNNTDANTLLQTIQSQMRLEHAKPAVPGTRPADAHGPKNGAATTQAFTAAWHNYLAADQINMLKQAEWPQDDNTVKVAFNGDVRKRYVANAAENAAAFNALSSQEQAMRILSGGRVEERKDVKIVNDPVPLAEYKRAIQPMILTGCATAGCHGGANGSKFFLYGTPENEAATYTNFYLLTQGSAQVGAARRMMIDRTYNDSSLLALFGLPPEVSKVAHPEVKGATVRPLFRTREDPQYKALMKWMGKLVTPEPRYGFTFLLEGEGGKPDKPGTQPVPPVPPVPPVKPQ